MYKAYWELLSTPDMQTVDRYIEPIRALLSRVEKQTRLLSIERVKALYPPGSTIDHEESEQFENLIAAMESEIALSEELANEDRKYWYGYARSFKGIWAKYSDPAYYRAMHIVDTVSEYLDKNTPEAMWIFGLEEGIWELECLAQDYGGEYWTGRYPDYEVSNIFDFVFGKLAAYNDLILSFKRPWAIRYSDYERDLKEAYRVAWGREIRDYILVENSHGGYSPVNTQRATGPWPLDWMWMDGPDSYLSYDVALQLVLIDNGNPICFCDGSEEYVEIEMLKVKKQR